jgi:hypothetical protein
MSAINTPVVLRSHVLLGRPWGGASATTRPSRPGRGLRGGRVPRSRWPRASRRSLPPARAADAMRCCERFVLPAPGEGPDPRRGAGATSTCVSWASRPMASTLRRQGHGRSRPGLWLDRAPCWAQAAGLPGRGSRPRRAAGAGPSRRRRACSASASIARLRAQCRAAVRGSGGGIRHLRRPPALLDSDAGRSPPACLRRARVPLS